MGRKIRGFVVLILCVTAQAEEQTHWTYQGEAGPEHWAELEEGAACDGARQSPVNIIRTDTLPDTQASFPLTLKYSAATLVHSVTNNGHSIQYDFAPGDEINFLGEDFALKQVHFHEPSEHTLNGVRFPLELHMVHYSEARKEYVVLAVMGHEGKPSPAYEVLESHLPLATGETKLIDEAYDLSDALPNSMTPRFHYEGSLTTPPCSENVHWIVFEEPFMLGHEQVRLLKELMPTNNYRSVQPLNDRRVSLIVH
jgi:carbonic anhydrase